MNATSNTVRPAKTYAIVEGRYRGAVDLGPLGLAPIQEGPWTIRARDLLDHRGARRQAAALRAELNPTGSYDGAPCVLVTTRIEDYLPEPERRSAYEIRAVYLNRAAPFEIPLDPRKVTRKSSAMKQFRDYVKRAEDRAPGRGLSVLVTAELIREDFYKGKPAGVETVARLSDVSTK